MQSFFKLAAAFGLVTLAFASTAEHLVSHGMAQFIHSNGTNDILNTASVKLIRLTAASNTKTVYLWDPLQSDSAMALDQSQINSAAIVLSPVSLPQIVLGYPPSACSLKALIPRATTGEFGLVTAAQTSSLLATLQVFR
jgi:hypothetical protein